MNTINATAWANLKKNKGRNILTGIAILLTTFSYLYHYHIGQRNDPSAV